MNRIDRVFRLHSKQWLAGLAATMAMINVGNEEMWLIETLENMRNPDPESKDVTNCILAGLILAAISSVIGTFIGAILAENLGRKKAFLATSIFAISQIFASFITNGILSCIILCLGEIGLGITRVIVPLYVSEIVDDNIRGTLLMFQLPFLYIGKLIAFLIGNLVSTKLLGVISLVLTGIYLVIFTRLPETPYFLSSKKKDEAAIRSLAFYRGIEISAAEEEIDLIRKNVEAKDDSQGYCGKIQELLRPTNRKSFIIIMVLIIMKWSERIFDTRNDLIHITASGTSSINKYQPKIIAYVTTLIGSLLIAFTIDTIGRRSFLTYSTFVGFTLMTIALIFRGNHRSAEWAYNLLAIILHLCELIIFSVLTVYVGELFLAKVKAMSIAIVTTFELLMSFVIIILLEATGVDMNSVIGGILVLFAFPITFAFVPETKRKSFSDIQSELAKTLHCEWLKKKLTRSDEIKYQQSWRT